MDQFNLEYQTESVINKIRHYLITTMGKTADTASDEEYYKAFSFALREEVMINWTATQNTFQQSDARKIYYLSMEYMPGRLLGNNLTNISAMDLVKNVLHSMKRDFSKIMCIEPEIGIGNGGLGRLASCFMDSLATLEYPAIGYGMRYQYGIFEQAIWCGIQIEKPECWLLLENPWEFRRDSHAVNVDFCGKPIKIQNSDHEIYDIVDQELVRALPYDLPIIGYNPSPNFSVTTLRLWSTKESPHNFQLQRYNAGQLDQAAENTSLTDVLYPNDNHEAGKRIRLKQEFLLVSASLQDILNQHLDHYSNLNNFKDKVRIQINDTHPALVVAELMRTLMKNGKLSWKEAFETTQEVCSYTNHTVLKEALEEWNENRVQNLLPRQYNIIQRLDKNLREEVRTKYKGDTERENRMAIIDCGQIRMAHLSIYGSHHINGVAALHSEILKESMFRDFFEMYPEKFTNVTNGVTQRRWLLYCNPKHAEFLTKRIGDGWIKDFKEVKKLAQHATCKETQAEFLKIKQENKQALIDHLTARDNTPGADDPNVPTFLGTDALFDIHIKRFHEYKRQFMNAMHALILFQEIKENPSARKIKRMVFFGGKAAPGYELAKDIIRFIYCLSRKIFADSVVREHLRVIFIPNYNVSNAEKIIPACDLSEQISTAGMEASGTGNMKLAMNGALTIGTDDGANVEMRQHVTDEWWPFLFGQNSSENAKMKEEKSYHPSHIVDNNPMIKKAVEALRDGTLSENEAEHETLCRLYATLMEGTSTVPADKYLVLNDLQSYYDAHKKVEDLYSNKEKWAEYALHNIAGMGYFSSDESIRNYANELWGLKPCPPSKEELNRIRTEYSELDRCRILPNGMKKAQ
ncbi:MAG: Glycogen phosphorylase [Chlamydiia bacterium]|nr:Glycogen phosphorylase [Chlamydiia bacterium]